jgi:hypothetical protein
MIASFPQTQRSLNLLGDQAGTGQLHPHGVHHRDMEMFVDPLSALSYVGPTSDQQEFSRETFRPVLSHPVAGPTSHGTTAQCRYWYPANIVDRI